MKTAEALARSYDELLPKLATACIERERVLAQTPVDIKALQDVNRTLLYFLIRVRFDDRKLRKSLQKGFFRDGDIYKLLNQAGDHAKLLQTYIAVFQEFLPSIEPSIKRLCQLLRNENTSSLPTSEAALTEQLQHVARIFHENYENQFINLGRQLAPDSIQNKYVASSKESFWIIVKIVAVLSIYLNNVRLLVGWVKGTDTTSNVKKFSPLYAKVTPSNVLEVFQTDLTERFGPHILGAKVVAYLGNDGRLHVAFLTEATATHHRHAAALLAHLVDHTPNDAFILDAKSDALYDGDTKRAGDALSRSAGYQLQYDAQRRQVIDIQQDSWLTNYQTKHFVLTQHLQESMLLAILSSIDSSLLGPRIANMEQDMLSRTVLRKA